MSKQIILSQVKEATIDKASDYLIKTSLDFIDKTAATIDAHIYIKSELKALNKNEGILIAYINFRDTSGRIKHHGPHNFGKSTKPHYPLSDLINTKDSLNKLSNDVLPDLEKPHHTFEGYSFYWATNTGSLFFDVSKLDPDKLTAIAINDNLRLRLQAKNTYLSEGSKKIIAQAKVFSALEDRFRNNIQEKNLELKHASIKNEIQKAENLFIDAEKQRKKALTKANKFNHLQELSQTLGLIANFSSLAKSSQAEANYHGTTVYRAANEYNNTVNTYNNFFILDLGLRPEFLPSNPNINPDFNLIPLQ